MPFGQRYEVSLRYYDLPDQPLLYRHQSPRKVACCYPFNAYWTANAALDTEAAPAPLRWVVVQP